MPYITINSKIKSNIKAQTMKVFKDFYTDSQFELIKDLYLTYYNRGGELDFIQFAMMPITKDAGDITTEHGEWTKYIRNKLATDWYNSVMHCV